LAPGWIAIILWEDPPPVLRAIGYNLRMPVGQRLRIPIWREGRVVLERASLLRDPVLRGAGVPRGDGAPLLMIPGFMAGDLSLTLMARWLRDIGYRPCRAGIRANVDCTERALARLDAQLERVAEHHGRRVRIVGHSRGGTMARILAVRRPDLVEGIVCLGSPLTDQLNVHPLVRAQVRAVALLGTLGVPGLFTYGCGSGCCADATADTTAPFPDHVAFTSVYSRSDGVVAWRACLDPAATAVEVRSSHVGMAVNPEAFRAVADALERTGARADVDDGPAQPLVSAA
jgi:triacylglycerol lipase